MKKTLTLLALLGMLAANPLAAEEHWMVGVTCHDNNSTDEWLNYNYPKVVDAGAYTFSKDQADTYATNQCWVASGADTLAWWQDQVEANGALIIHSDIPRGQDLWKAISPMFIKSGGWPYYVMNYWLWGEMPYGTSSFLDSSWAKEHPDFKGYFGHLKGQFQEYTAEYRMIVNKTPASISVKIPGDEESMAEARADYLRKEQELVAMVDEGWGLAFCTTGDSSHALAAYGFETNEEGRIITMWYTDNNPGYVREGLLESTSMEEEFVEVYDNQQYRLKSYTGYGTISSFYGIRTRGIQFDTYELTMKGEATDEVLFSHYLDLVIDGATDYKLQYDLRNAKDTGSPVTAKDNAGNLITTGDITLKKGQLSLVAGVEKYDGGGKTSGTITFEGSADTKRTLSVQHTDTIAAGIVIAAAEGNTLDVAAGVTAGFGTLSGKGNLDKTGLGTAEVTGAVTLQGDIRVHAGSFIFGTDATISETTSLTVDAGAHVRGKEGESLTLTIASGVHENNGVMSLATTMTGGVLKGSGTFAGVTVAGGTLIVGNSPGRQTYTGNLTVNMGEIVFGVSGWETAADEDHVGWGSGAYSNVAMTNGVLTLGEGCHISFGVADDALAALLSGNGGSFSMTIATGIGNGDYFKSDLLRQLADQTIFYVTDEAGAAIANDAGLKAGDTLNTYINDLQYNLVDNTQLCITGVFWAAEPMVPEPATGTLGLLALCALAARRRRR